MESNSNSGIKFVTHSPFEPPPIETKYEVVGVGKRAYVQVQMFNETYLERPWSHCSKTREKEFLDSECSKKSAYSNYTTLSCESECRKSIHMSFCECLPFFFFDERTKYSNDYPECNPSQVMNCSFKVQREINKYINNNCEENPLCDRFELRNNTCDFKKFCPNYCNCPSACNTITYSTRVSYTTFPCLNEGDNSFNIFYRDLADNTSYKNGHLGTQRHYHKLDQYDLRYVKGIGVTDDFLRNNLVGLKVYFNQLSYQDVIEMKQYGIGQLQGDIGGTLSALTGHCFINVIELLINVNASIYKFIAFGITSLYYWVFGRHDVEEVKPLKGIRKCA